MKNSVLFKGTKDGITVVLSENFSFSEILEQLKIKIDESKQYFGGEKTNIKITGRNLSTLEEEEVFDIIAKTANLEIAFIGLEKYFTSKSINSTQKPDELIPVPEKSIFTSTKNTTYFHTGTLRSGDIINFEGSVVVIGDTNPGSEINAQGNIIVQGKIGGIVHAGCYGDYNCYVSAFNLSPIQLRISDKIIQMPEEILKENKTTFIPRMAYIKDDQITIKNLLRK